MGLGTGRRITLAVLTSVAALSLVAPVAAGARARQSPAHANAASFTQYKSFKPPKPGALKGESKSKLAGTLAATFTAIEKALNGLNTKIGTTNGKDTAFLTVAAADAKFLPIANADTSFLTIANAKADYLTPATANGDYVGIGATAADASKLGGQPSSAYVQGQGNIASNALTLDTTGSTLPATPTTLVQTANGMIAVTVAADDAQADITVDNGTGDPLTAVRTVAGTVSGLTLDSGQTVINNPKDGLAVEQLQLQISPNSTFNHVVTLLISADPTSASTLQMTGQLVDGGI